MSRMIHAVMLCLVATALTAGGPLRAGETKTDEKKPAKETAQGKNAEEAKKESTSAKSTTSKSDTHTVEKGPLVITVTLDGSFEAQTMHEISVRPKQWATLSVLEAVEHGRRIKRGDLLVTFDTEKIDIAVADLRDQLKSTELSVKLAEEGLKSLEATVPLDLAAGQRALRISAEDLQRYLKVKRPWALKTADFNLKRARQYVEYQEEEVRQLEKMYEADDLTEETEKIVLKRARNTLEAVRFNLEMDKMQHEETMKLDIPRQDERVKDAAKRVDLQWKKDRITLPIDLKKARLALDKTKIDYDRAKKKLDELLADREALLVKAPADGIIYYGKCVRGKFSSSSSLAENLRRGGAVSANSIFMTVVEPKPMFVRATVPEKQLQYLRAGLKGTVEPVGYPELKLTAIVERVDPVPVTSGSFDSRITVELGRPAARLLPGMTCKAKFVPYRKKSTLTVPTKAVHADEWDDQVHYVYLVTESGESKKQVVTAGKRTDKKVEILKGLAAGDKVLLEAPKKD